MTALAFLAGLLVAGVVNLAESRASKRARAEAQEERQRADELLAEVVRREAKLEENAARKVAELEDLAATKRAAIDAHAAKVRVEIMAMSAEQTLGAALTIRQLMRPGKGARS